MRSYKAEGIVIKRKNFSESDRIITIFTKTEGKIQVKASGVRKITSRRAPHIELLNHSFFNLYRGKSMSILTEVEIVNNYSDIKNDLKKVGFAYHICELIDGLCAEGQENLAVFSLLQDTLKSLSTAEKADSIITNFENRLLTLLGFRKQNEDLSEADMLSFIERLLERKLRTRQILPRFA